jgi:glyoxylase-like metal-dependent hydrolase (beta-lactamase superfamily II)
MSRRIAFAFAAAALLNTAACGDAQESEPLQGEIAGTLSQFTSDAAGFDTHSFYYDTGRQVIVFDAQFTEDHAEQLLAQIQATTSSPIAYVVITHPNPDKFNGVGPLRAAGAKVVASEETAAAIPGVHAYKKGYFIGVGAFTEETYPPEATVDLTFSGELDLALEGGARVHLATLDHPGVSTTQTVAHIPAIGALVVGDLIHHQAHAWLEGGIRDGQPDPDLAAWRLALDELKAYPGTTVFGGRGASAPLATAVAEQQQYLLTMDQIVSDYVAGVPDPADLSGPNAGAHYQQITDLAVEAFPERELSYLITYGVYGLVNEIAQQ